MLRLIFRRVLRIRNNIYYRKKMKTEPLISIISIFYNSAEYVRKNVDSIRSQKNVNLEIILVDDCSSDNTRSILKEYASIDSRIKLIFHDENKGISEARNSGIKAATGDCFYFIDGDDFLTHSRSLATLARHWTVDMDWVAGSYEVVDENGRIVRKIDRKRLSANISAIWTSSISTIGLSTHALRMCSFLPGLFTKIGSGM